MFKSEDIVYFGIGEDVVVEKVVVEWYNGGFSILLDFEVN